MRGPENPSPIRQSPTTTISPGPWTPLTKTPSISAVRLGPVIITVVRLVNPANPSAKRRNNPILRNENHMYRRRQTEQNGAALDPY